MKRTWPMLVAFSITACSTFSDLEQQHPFDAECQPGTVPNEAGECIPSVNNASNAPNNENNLSNPPNNANNLSNVPNNTPCELGPGECCPTPDGEMCCTDDGCCYQDPAECFQPTNNANNPNQSDQYALVIADAGPQECLDQDADGPDIFGVSLTVDNGDAFPFLVAFQPGANTQFSEDDAQAVIEQFDPDNIGGCPQQESFSLGCGGWVAVGFGAQEPIDPTSVAHLIVAESAPQCDNSSDRYAIFVCPYDQLQDPNGCYPIADSVEGTFDEVIQF